MFICTKCGISKGIEDFPSAKGKRHSWCRACNNAAKKKAREELRKTTPRKKRITSDCITSTGEILCSNCGNPKPPSMFPNGRPGWCRSCRAELESARRRERGIREKEFATLTETTKQCMCCGEMKNFSEFYTSKRGSGGVASYCKFCFLKKFKDKGKARVATSKYRQLHKERHLAAHRVRMFEYRNRKAVTDDGSITEEFLVELYATEECFYCKKITQRESRTADHRVPLNKGGTHSVLNLVMACVACNCSKQDMSEADFRKKKGYLVD